MSQSNHLLSLAIAVGLSLSPWQALQAKSPRAAAAQADAEGRSTWIVVFEEPAIASFRGGKPSKSASVSLAATTPAVTGDHKFDIDAPASRAYAAYLAEMRSERLIRAEVEFGRPLTPGFVYDAVLNGVSLELTASEAARMATMPGVSKVMPNWVSKPLTDAGPRWIKADQVWSGIAGVQSRGEGVIVGVIDTGVNASHPMFAASSGGVPISNPRGSGNFLGPLCASGSPCNNKLIGMWDFTTGSSDTEPNNGLDVDGHGSHTASTAVGNPMAGNIDGPSGPVPVTFTGVAPRANLITYKACEQESDCVGTWLLAAINRAVSDGVDVINYSIGGGANSPWNNGDAIAFRGARDAGIVVVAAAGNDGPGAGSINSPANAPWVLAAAASTHNRLIANELMLSGGTAPVPGAGTLVGASNTGGTASGMELVLADVPLCSEGSDIDFPPTDAGISKPTSWGPNHFNANQIVVCERGINARVAKSNNVRLAGGGGMVLINQQADGTSINADAHAIPSTHLEYADGQALKAWIAQGNGPKGQLTISKRTLDDNKADRMASFSSRGPNPGDSVNIEGILKPDLSAPGVDIVAAGPAATGTNGPDFQFLSGTSMATPHVAGAAALIIGARNGTLAAKGPLRVDQVVSALTSSARPSGIDTDGVTPATPFDQGAGIVDVSKAVRAGLYLPTAASTADGIPSFVSANPNSGGDVRKLNLPSLTDPDCFDTCTFKRKLTAYGGGAGTWVATVEGLPAGVSVNVTPASFTLTSGASQVISVDVTISDAELLGKWAFGAVRIARSPASSTVSDLRLPLAVKRSVGAVPAPIVRTVSGDAGFFDIAVNGMNTLPDARFADSALAAPVVTATVLAEDPDNDPYNAGSGVTFRSISVPPGPNGAPASYRLRVDLTFSTTVDMNMYVGSDFDGDGLPSEAEELCSSTSDNKLPSPKAEHCELNIQHPGGTGNLSYWWLVQNFFGSTDTANVTSTLVSLDATDTSLTVTGPGKTGKLEPFTMRVAWNDPSFKPGQTRKGFALLAPTPGNVVAQIPVTLIRDSTPSVARALVNKVDLPITVAAGETLDRIFFDVPPNAREVTFTAAGASGVDLYAAPAPARTDNRTTIDPAPAVTNAPFNAIGTAASKTITVPGAALTPGRWYLTAVSRGASSNIVLRAAITQADPPPALRSGHYFDAGRIGSSSGLFLDFSGNTWFAVWYAYLEDGTPTWYFGQGAAPSPTEPTATFRGDLLRVVWNGSTASNVKVGELLITPTGPETFDFSFTVDGKTGSEPMTRLGAGGCIIFGGDNLDVSGHWFNDKKPGFGYSAQLQIGDGTPDNPDQEIFAAYLYDAQGFPRWLFGLNKPFNAGQPIALKQFDQGACPTCAFKATALFDDLPVIGTLDRGYASNNITQIGVSANLSAPLVGTWAEVSAPVMSLSEPKLCQ